MDLLPCCFRNILSYLSVEIEIDLESNWYRRSRTHLGFNAANNLCNNVPTFVSFLRDSRNFTIFLPFRNHKCRSFDVDPRDYGLQLFWSYLPRLLLYKFLLLLLVSLACSAISIKNRGETSREPTIKRNKIRSRFRDFIFKENFSPSEERNLDGNNFHPTFPDVSLQRENHLFATTFDKF